jgi:4-diphosphocytidyl-2-C-methyl-D-erythritol kinase
MAGQLGALEDNLILLAVRALAAHVDNLASGRFELDKQVPIAAGLGGGSSDAAAALRLLARLNGIEPGDARLHAAAVATGADVAVCLDPRARVMMGIGDKLSPPLHLPALAAVLVNPGTALATAAVFTELARRGGTAGRRDAVARPLTAAMPGAPSRTQLMEMLAAYGNDLEVPATALQPAIGEVLRALRATAGCRLARMSGSGATCFALYDAQTAAAAASRALRNARPDWWVRETILQ